MTEKHPDRESQHSRQVQHIKNLLSTLRFRKCISLPLSYCYYRCAYCSPQLFAFSGFRCCTTHWNEPVACPSLSMTALLCGRLKHFLGSPIKQTIRRPGWHVFCMPLLWVTYLHMTSRFPHFQRFLNRNISTFNCLSAYLPYFIYLDEIRSRNFSSLVVHITIIY